jgi:D-alanyl-D-alanine carboxypeptidase
MMAELVLQQAQFSLDVCTLIGFATSRGFLVTLGRAYSTPYEQAEYVRLGLSKTMDSAHLSRLAIDLNFFMSGQLASRSEMASIGAHWESLSSYNRWGGNFKNFYDAGHFQRNKQ